MESADRIPFAASRGLRRQAFTWRERLKPRKRRKYLPRLLLLVWMTIFLGFVFGAPRAFEVLLATFSPLRVMGLVVCGLALVIVVRLIPRTQPFRGYLDRGGLVIETRGSETRFAWDDFVAREA
ncbi:MAG TPA: hypothetical protein VHG32_04075, partial [Thermoanaerobaculia bacterium]|nr:hypothetical protein [Thermoanaerobaculia bacterium]